MEAIKEYSYTIVLLYIIIGVILVFLDVVWHVIFSGIAYFSLQVFWINLATEISVYTVLYVAIVIILSVLSQRRPKKKRLNSSMRF
jgi:NADH:ubiquinone oxidoreductase subunit 3 (subunit A)